MKIFVSVPTVSIVRSTFFSPEVQSYLEKCGQVTYSPLDRHLRPEEFAQYAGDADVLMTGWGHPMIDANLLKGTSIKLIAHTGGSVADYVSSEVYDMGIRVISGNELYAESVAEGALAYMLLALRRMPDYVQEVRSGGWELPCGTEGLLDQTVGIVGMGTISRKLIRLLNLFRVKLKLYSSHPIDRQYLDEIGAVQASIEEIFSTCKIVSLHSALNDQTRGMIGKEHFDLLQDGAVFVNTARGAIVRENELIEALKENRFRAVLDVYEKEPLAADSLLRALPNVYCIPHKGGPTIDRRPFITKRLADDILRFANAQPLQHEITPNRAKRMTRERS